MRHLVDLVGDWIITPRVPRMAFREAAYAEPDSAGRTVSIDGLGRVGGAARMETAVVAEKRADEVLVTPDQGD
jgi:hypothetical protein